MLGEALGIIPDIDAALLIVDAGTDRPGDAEEKILRALAEARRPVVLGINKVDTVKNKEALLPRLERWNQQPGLRALVPISASRGTNVDRLVDELWALLPEGPPLFDADHLTDRTERFLAAELIREQFFIALRQEVPYADRHRRRRMERAARPTSSSPPASWSSARASGRSCSARGAR